MQIAILCGGLATRLAPLSTHTPKSMIKIHGKPFLEYQINTLKKNKITNIVLCVGHLADQIIDYFGNGKKFNVHITYSHDGKTPLGPAGALKKAADKLENIFFTLYGDSYVFLNFQKIYNHFSTTKNLAMMTVFQNHDKYDTSNIVVKNNKVIKYNKNKTPDMTYIDYGVSIFRKQTLHLIPHNTFFTTKDLYTKLVEKNELQAYPVTKRFYHIGTPEALQDFNRFILST